MGHGMEWAGAEPAGPELTDPATGLFERSVFLLELKRELVRSERTVEPFTIALIELAGDRGPAPAIQGPETEQHLSEFGALVRNSIRDFDLGCRCAARLFALLLLKTSADVAHVVGERIRKAVEQRFGGTLSVSVGMASYPVDAADRDGLLAKAGQALECARTEGGNRVHYVARPAARQGEDKPRVLVVDDDRRNVKLMASYLLPQGYEVLSAHSGEEALELIAHTEVDLLLLDIMMPGVDGYEVCKRIKNRDSTRLVPVILVTALDDIQAKIRGIEAGADDFITKPANREELLARTVALIRVRKLNKSLTSVENALFSLARAVEAKDNYTLGHTQRVANLALALGRRLSLGEQEVSALRIGGILHDVGKIGITEDILNKPGKLDEREWAIMRSHPEIGYGICLPLKATLGLALDVVRHHHEKLDGSSYPDGLKGEEISMASRILCVVDIYDALVTRRPYRIEMPKAKALEILNLETAGGKLDGRVVAELVDLVG